MTTVKVSRCACGSDTRQLYSFKDKAECAEHMRWMERGYQVQCGINFCGLRGPTCDTEDEAIDGWNRMQAALAPEQPSEHYWWCDECADEAATPPQEPVAYVMSFEGEPRIAILRASALEPGTKLYLAPPANDEAVRLREIEHRAWHVLDDTEERDDCWVIDKKISGDDMQKLAALLPEDHPTHKQEGKGNG